MEEDWRKQTEENLSTWGYAPSISIEKDVDGEVLQLDQDGFEGSCNSGFNGVSSLIFVLHERNLIFRITKNEKGLYIIL